MMSESFALPTKGSRADCLVDTSAAIALLLTEHPHHDGAMRAAQSPAPTMRPRSVRERTTVWSVTTAGTPCCPADGRARLVSVRRRW